MPYADILIPLTHYSGLMIDYNQTKLNLSNAMVGYECIKLLLPMMKYNLSINS